MYRLFPFILLFMTSMFSYAQPVINIGAPLPFTGKLSLEAAKQKRGYELWADIVNAQGGIDVAGVNHVVKITYIDYQPKFGKARAAVESLVMKHKVNLLFAPYGSMAAREASAVAEKHQIPMIAVTASSHQTYSRGHKYIFGIFTPNQTLIDPLMDLVQKESTQVNRIALVVRKDLFPLSIAREVVKSSNDRGIDVVFYEKYAIDTKDYAAQLIKLKKLNPNWIFALGYTSDLVLLRKQMSEFGISAQVLTMMAAPAYQEFIDETGALSENITSTAWWHPAVRYTGNDIFGTTEYFVDAFYKRYGKRPDYVEASAALAGTLFQLAIERSGSIKGALVRDALANIDETTFWGPIRFAENGQNNAPSPLVFQIQNKKAVVIYPNHIATGQLRLGVN